MHIKTNLDVINSNSIDFIGIQFDFYQSMNHYVEKKIHYLSQPVLYYQFHTKDDKSIPKIIPDGCVDLLFCCDPKSPKAFICGSVLKAKQEVFQPNTTYFGVRLSSKLSTEIPNLSFKETIDTELPFQHVFPKHQDLPYKIFQQTTFQNRINCFEQHCSSILYERNDSPLLNQCLYEIISSKGLVSIQQLSSSTGYSTRYIRNKFDEIVGLSPKHFAQIIRFQQTLKFVLQQQPLVDITYNMGYFDQAHLSKKFKHFSNMTPSQMMKQFQSPNHSCY